MRKSFHFWCQLNAEVQVPLVALVLKKEVLAHLTGLVLLCFWTRACSQLAGSLIS
jgi:hypothetical protein